MTLATRSCPRCGSDVSDGPWNKVYCGEQCRRLYEKKRWSQRKRDRLAAQGLTSRGARAKRDSIVKQLTKADRDTTQVILGERVSDTDLSAYRRTVLSDPCSYCGGQADTYDHIVPRSAVIDNSWKNIAAACRSCNSSKSNATLLSFMLRRETLEQIRMLKERAAADFIPHTAE